MNNRQTRVKHMSGVFVVYRRHHWKERTSQKKGKQKKTSSDSVS